MSHTPEPPPLPEAPRGARLFERRLSLPCDVERLFAWHERPGAFERLCPPWDRVKIISKSPHIKDGAHARLRIKLPLGLPATLEVTHEGYAPPARFVDRQLKGPFSYWRHQHLMSSEEGLSSEEGGGSVLTDRVEYKLPLGPLGQLGGGALARARLEQLFHYRHEVTRHDFALHAASQFTPHAPDGERLKVAVSGASGFIGEPLCALLSTAGYEVIKLVRRAPQGPEERAWPTPSEVPDLSDVYAVIHLAGESVAQRWTQGARERILKSRMDRTQALSEALSSAHQKGERAPQHLICASAVGYYGAHPELSEPLDELAPRGEGFLAEVCEAWERACEPARDAGVRVVNVRVGVVLAPNGGALERLLLPFNLGLGGPVGSGRQAMSWVSLHDAVGAFYWALTHPELSGPLNAVAPERVSSAGFARALGRALGRPALLPAPAFALKLAFGEMAQEALLSGQSVVPSALERSGYPFMLPQLEGALRFELGRVEGLRS